MLSELVSKFLTAKADEKNEIETKLKEEMPGIKNVVNEVKKYK